MVVIRTICVLLCWAIFTYHASDTADAQWLQPYRERTAKKVKLAFNAYSFYSGGQDLDGDLLGDIAELYLAQAFVPFLKFDSRENALLPVEPVTIFQVRPQSCVGIKCGYPAPPAERVRTTVALKFAFLFHKDGGYATAKGYEFNCWWDDHIGDNEGVTVYIGSDDGLNWRLLTLRIGEYLPTPPLEIYDLTHPVIYPSAGKHHIFGSPGDVDDSPHSKHGCPDGVNGVGVQLIPSLVNSMSPRYSNNVGEPEQHLPGRFVNSLDHLGFLGDNAWSDRPFGTPFLPANSPWANTSSLLGMWLKTPPLGFSAHDPTPFSCGPGLITYHLAAFYQVGIRCFLQSGEKFAWYGETNDIYDRKWRTFGTGSGTHGSLVSITGNGEKLDKQLDLSFDWNAAPSKVLVNYIENGHAMTERWELVDGPMHYEPFGPISMCAQQSGGVLVLGSSPQIQQYQAFADDPNTSGSGIRCRLGDAWFGEGDWNGTHYRHIALLGPQGYGLFDMCQPGTLCGHYDFGTVTVQEHPASVLSLGLGQPVRKVTLPNGFYEKWYRIPP